MWKKIIDSRDENAEFIAQAMECNYEGVEELRRELEQGLKTTKQEAEHPVQRREDERQRDHEKKIASGEASLALDRANEIGSEPTAQAQLLTPPVSPIHFTIQILQLWGSSRRSRTVAPCEH